MRKKHSFSPNHKVVDGPHNYSEPHGSAEPAGGGAQGPAPQMFSNGGKACYADGGDILGGGVRGKMADYGSAIKQTASDMFGGKSGSKNPVASGNADEKYEGTGGAARNSSIDQAVKDAGG